MTTAIAQAHPNIALIKYWGNRDDALRLPRNGSISMTLAGLHTVTRVSFDPDLELDTVTLNRRPAAAGNRERVVRHLDLVRSMAGASHKAEVVSANDFPAGAGLASSASAFAALTLAAAAAAGLDLTPTDLSRLARRGSGSASRSVFGGYVEWRVGQDDESSFAEPIAGPDHWELVDLIALVGTGPKPVGSTEGHQMAATSPLQETRVASAEGRLATCRRALLERDFARLGEVVELDCHLMHAVMQTCSPPLFYWAPASIAVMQAVRSWREAAANVCYTVDAGPNVHCLCPADSATEIGDWLQAVPGVSSVLRAGPGGSARLLDSQDPLTALL
jgi:diphosphomevalonate decarboxylase